MLLLHSSLQPSEDAMRILITGVSGFIGKHTAIAAIKAGHSVTALGRTPLSAELKDIGVTEYKLRGWPLNTASSDLFELTVLVRGLDAVIHIAGDARYGNGRHYQESNVVPTELLINAIKSSNSPCKFVLASSVGAQDFPRFSPTKTHNEMTKARPRSDYGRSKLDAEGVVGSSGVDFSIARLGMVVGPGMREESHVSALLSRASSPWFRRALSLWRGYLPLVHVYDAADALLLLANSITPPGPYLVVSSNVSIASVLNASKLRFSREGFFSFGFLAGFLPARISTATSPVMRFNSSKLRQLGWDPIQDLGQAIKLIDEDSRISDLGLHVITGVASGLGRAVMEQIILENGQIIGIDQNRTVIDQLRIKYPKQQFLCKDTTDPNLFDQVQSISTSLSLKVVSLYLIAGIGKKSSFVTQDFDDIRRQFEVNVLARINLAKNYLKYLDASRITGKLIIVSSSTALQPLPDFAVYGATNAALLSFGRSLIMETRADQCKITLLIPGGMDTNFQNSAGVRRLKNESLLNPTTIARNLVSTTSKRSRIQIIGRNARIAQIGSRTMPWRLADAVWARLTKLTR